MSRPGKPAGLVTRAETKAKKAARVAKEESLRPGRGLSLNPPARLKDRKGACAAWRRLIKRYSELAAEIVTGLDWVLVENFCLSVDELDQLIEMQQAAYQNWLLLAKAQKQLVDEHKFDDAVLMAIQVMDCYETYLKTDARVDRKKELLHKLGQSLYITPRSRAGVAPVAKEKAPVDPFEEFLDSLDDDDYVWNEKTQEFKSHG